MKLSIRTKLLAALGLDLALMLILGSFALNQMSAMNEEATFVAAQTIPSIDTVNTINDILLSYRNLQVEYIINVASADKLRIEGEMHHLEEDMAKAFITYDHFQLDENERATFEQTRAGWEQFVTATHTQFIPSNRDSNTGNVHPSFSRLAPLYDNLLSHVRQIKQQSQQRATTALGRVRAAYDASRLVILSETTLTIVVSAVIGLTLSSNIARRIRKLRDATMAIAGGDLNQTVALRGSDELQLLANNFNLMVASLRQQHLLLAQRNTELSESLETQRKLMSDLVQRKQAEEAADRARATAEAASQAKSMFLATMSHELRTPLNAILGYVQLLHLEAQIRGNTDMLPDLERIRSAGKHLLTIISNILDFSKIEQGKMNLEIDTFEISSVANEVIGIFSPLAHSRGIDLTLICPPEIGLMRSDAGKVRQVLFNLLSNAVKFTERGHITLTISHEYHSGKAWIFFSVADTGIGINPEQMGRLFQAFSQVHHNTFHHYGGTGLGLALSRQLCQMLGGDITVESETGKGSVFSVCLPADIGTVQATRQTHVLHTNGNLPRHIPGSVPSLTPREETAVVASPTSMTQRDA